MNRIQFKHHLPVDEYNLRQVVIVKLIGQSYSEAQLQLVESQL